MAGIHHPAIGEEDGCGPRLVSLLDHGLRLTTEYSGMDCPVEALVQLEKAMHKILGRPMDDPRSRFTFQSACDNDELAQSVFLDLIQRRGGQSCLFGDISDRLPWQFRKGLLAKEQKEDASMNEAKAAYANIAETLMDNRKWLFGPQAESGCLVHERQFLVPRQMRLASGSCLAAPLSLNVAGTICVGWSAAGGRAGFSHPSELPHAVWLAQRIAREEDATEDMFFQECTEQYPAIKKIREPCSRTHKVIVVETGPELQGWPTRRPRSFTAALSLARLRWRGPTTDEGIQNDFDELLGRSMELTGDAFSLAPSENILADLNRRLKLRGLAEMSNLPEPLTKDLLLQVLPPVLCRGWNSTLG